MARKNNKGNVSRDELTRRITSGRSSLLLILIFTVVNLLFLVTDVDRYFLFSASLPYYLTMMGKGMDNGFMDGAWAVNGTYTITALVLSAAVLVFFLLCWLLSKKRSGWLTAALVLFILDTAALALFTFTLYDNPAVNLMDFIFHIWAIVSLLQAIRASGKLKELPPEEEVDLSSFYGSIPSLSDDSEEIG